MKTMNFLKSFKHAIDGIVFVFKNEQNFRIQILVSFFVLALVFIFNLKKFEIIILLLLIILVLILEILNSAFEKFVDLLKPRLHFEVKIVKDILSAMVLLSAVGSGIIGLMIFWPYLANL